MSGNDSEPDVLETTDLLEERRPRDVQVAVLVPLIGFVLMVLTGRIARVQRNGLLLAIATEMQMGISDARNKDQDGE